MTTLGAMDPPALLDERRHEGAPLTAAPRDLPPGIAVVGTHDVP